MQVCSLSGYVGLKCAFLPLSHGPLVLGDKLIVEVDPDQVARSLNSDFLSYILDRNAVKGTIVLDVKISPDSGILLVVRFVLQYRKGQERRLSFRFKDRGAGPQFLGVILEIPGGSRYPGAP